MNEFQAAAVMAALFALRCVMPFLLLLIIGYGMNRLVDRWEREEKAQAGKRPLIPLAMAARTTKPAAKPNVPCWVFNNCDEKTRAGCPAYANRSLACWAARSLAEGRLPTKCVACPLYAGAPIPAAVG